MALPPLLGHLEAHVAIGEGTDKRTARVIKHTERSAQVVGGEADDHKQVAADGDIHVGGCATTGADGIEFEGYLGADAAQVDGGRDAGIFGGGATGESEDDVKASRGATGAKRMGRAAAGGAATGRTTAGGAAAGQAGGVRGAVAGGAAMEATGNAAVEEEVEQGRDPKATGIASAMVEGRKRVDVPAGDMAAQIAGRIQSEDDFGIITGDG